MPFPWKKVKSARISQLVNDHLHISQKRRGGSSLVVETGFPTSLIDLFFKNREKLKKPSKKKRRGQSFTPSDDARDPTILGSPISCPSPPPPPPPSPSPSLVGSPIPPRYSSILPPPPSCADEIYLAGSSGSDAGGGAVEEHRGGGDDNEVLLAVAKVFVVVVLALATRRLTVGITISAMSLLFLEYVAKHCRLLSTPCAAAISTARRCVKLFRCKESEPHLQQESSLSSRFPHQEIQAVESTAPVGIQPEKETACNYPETELLEMAMKREESMLDAADPNKKSKRAKLKSKMQKIFPKKFRRSRKDQELQTPSLIKDEEADQSEIGSVSSSSSNSNGSCREECRLSDAANEEPDTKIEDKGGAAEAALARTYMLLLCLIVLVGLIGGRPFALALTSSWLLLVKLGQKLQPRSIKLPMISC